ncbi:MAG: hypothetical protein JWQ65_1140, partial [Devosia sp.]|nr:hypothetical protein [Devosia sp.]
MDTALDTSVPTPLRPWIGSYPDG